MCSVGETCISQNLCCYVSNPSVVYGSVFHFNFLFIVSLFHKKKKE